MPKVNFLSVTALCLALYIGAPPAHGQAAQPQVTKPAKPAELPTASVESKPPEPLTPATTNSTPPIAPAEAVTSQENPDKPKQQADKAGNRNGSVLPRDRRAPYVIGPEDVLMIKVWQEGNLSGPVTVGPDGMISLQLIDEVKADGLTTDQLKNLLTQRLKAFITNPDVNVQVLRVVSRRFILLGEVSRPGAYPLTGPTTLMEALVFGGGFREFANVKKIYVLRTEIDPKTKMPETKKFFFNYKEVSHGKKMDQNILILNGDQIFVP